MPLSSCLAGGFRARVGGMLKDLKPSSFSELVGTRFLVDYGAEEPLAMELYEVLPHEKHPGPRPEPFSVFFRGPRTAVLPQRIYRVEHEKLGMMEIFLVPVGADEKGVRYEAVFN